MTLDIKLSNQNGSLFLSFKGIRGSVRGDEEESEVHGLSPNISWLWVVPVSPRSNPDPGTRSLLFPVVKMRRVGKLASP